MLIEFNVKNFCSMQERCSLSLVKAIGDELLDTNTFEIEPLKNQSIHLLRSAVIYGANASGKSNLLRALQVMSNIVKKSASHMLENTLDITPFLFDDLSARSATEFEVIFISHGIRYQYGFSASSRRIYDEWLIAYPKGRAQKLFSRVFNRESNTSEYKFNTALSGAKQVWQTATKDNSLFLSTAIQLNSDSLKNVYDWFEKKLYCLNSLSLNPTEPTLALLRHRDTKQEIIKFMKDVDLSIDDIELTEETFSLEQLSSSLPSSINFVYQTDSNQRVLFDFNEESDGTKRVFELSGTWVRALEQGHVLLVDVLHNHLHPAIVRYLIELFHSPHTNPNNAQLIFVTHETSILSQAIFRRDQVWFCEKNNHQSTKLYPLTYFRQKKGQENLGLAYLSGKYGAVPFIRNM